MFRKSAVSRQQDRGYQRRPNEYVKLSLSWLKSTVWSPTGFGGPKFGINYFHGAQRDGSQIQPFVRGSFTGDKLW
jgi:hypothetical protein